MRFIFIRHTQTEANEKKVYGGQVDYKLTKKGKSDLVKASKVLFEFYEDDIKDVKKIYTSPLSRCTYLSYEINKKINKEIIEDIKLLEYDFGIFEGKSYLELENCNNYKLWCNDFINFEIPSGESLTICRKRVSDFINICLENNEDIIVVAHEGIIKLAILELLGLQDEMFWNFKISNGGICEIENKNGISFIKNIINKV